MQHLPSELDRIVDRLNGLKDDIEQLQNDNKKLNDDLQVLEKSRDEAYKSFNTETHILVDRSDLKRIYEDISEAKTYANYACDESRSASSCAEEAQGSAESAEDYAKSAKNLIDEIIDNANEEKGANDGEE